MLFASGWHRLLLRPVAGFNGSTPACMSLVDPRDQCLSALRFARQSLFQHLDNVTRCQQLQTRLKGRVPLTFSPLNVHSVFPNSFRQCPRRRPAPMRCWTSGGSPQPLKRVRMFAEFSVCRIDPTRAWVGLPGLAGTGHSKLPDADRSALVRSVAAGYDPPTTGHPNASRVLRHIKRGGSSGTQHGEPEGASVRGGMRNGFVDAREREFRDADVIE